MTEASLSRFLPDAAATEAAGAALAACCPGGLVVYLYGDLGAGKTTLVRGLLRGCGHAGAVKSPTYTLVESYLLSGREVFHFDLYRLADPEELEYLGIRDYSGSDALTLVEWPERGSGFLPAANLLLAIEYVPGGRQLCVTAVGRRGKTVMDCLRSGWNTG